MVYFIERRTKVQVYDLGREVVYITVVHRALNFHTSDATASSGFFIFNMVCGAQFALGDCYETALHFVEPVEGLQCESCFSRGAALGASKLAANDAALLNGESNPARWESADAPVARRAWWLARSMVVDHRTPWEIEEAIEIFLARELPESTLAGRIAMSLKIVKSAVKNQLL